MDAVHASDPQALGAQSWSFTDKRLPEMLFRYRARNYPDTLTADEQAQWLAHCRARLIDGQAGHFSFNEFRAEIEQLRSELDPDAPKQRLLDEVAAFGAELEAFVQ
jgi:exodeoxyribonuclease-1